MVEDQSEVRVFAAGPDPDGRGVVNVYTSGGQLLYTIAQPVPGANSAAWIVGHLAVTLWRDAGRLGAPELPPLPAGWLWLASRG